MGTLTASLLFAGALLCQVPAPVPAPQQPGEPTVKPEDKCSVEGTVLNVQTGEPLKKAHVNLTPIQSQKFNSTSWGAVTDAAGRFLIDEVDPGKYRFSADRNGFVQMEYQAKAPGKSGSLLTLSKGQKLTDVVFRMTPHGVISGKVVDEDGEPLAGAGIMVMRHTYENGKRTLSSEGNASTNDRGEYRAYGIAPGKYFVCLSYDRSFGMQQVEIRKEGSEDGYVPTFYPNVSRSAQASQVEVTAGNEVSGIDFRLTPVHTARVTGRITNPGPGLRGLASVSLMPRDSGLAWAMMKDAIAGDKGNFQFRNVAPGSYTLTAQSFMNGGTEPQTAAAVVEVGDSNVDGIQLTFGAASEISGTVTADKGLDLKNRGMMIMLSPEETKMTMGLRPGQVQDDGTFKLKVPTPDRYSVNVYPMPEGCYVKSIRYGDTEYPNGVIDLSKGANGGELTITIVPNGGQIDGTVKDSNDQMAGTATVVLVPDQRDLHSLYDVARLDQNGHFTIKGVKPGKYKLFAWDDVEQGQYEDPDFLRPFEDKGEEIEVHGGDKSTKDLKLIVAGDASDN